MNVRGRFAEAFFKIKRLKVPSAMINGKITEPFYIDVDSVDGECIKGSGRVIEYHFVGIEDDLSEIIESAKERNQTTLLVHMQFLVDGTTDDALKYIAEQGCFKINEEHWSGSMQEKIVEMYSLCQAGEYCQYEGY